MKCKQRIVILLLILGSVALVIGCAPVQSEHDNKGGGSYPVGSLKSTHLAGELDGVDEYNNKLCLSCHTREVINAVTENYGGTEGFNPHQSHAASGDCVTCHSVESTSILTCNECHNETPPEGWESAERGLGPLHELS